MKGNTGAVGKGGFGGGDKTHNGKTFEIVIYKFSDVATPDSPRPKTCSLEIKNTIDYGTNPAGKNGIDNYVSAGAKNADPPLEFSHPAIAINEYKSFDRERLTGSSRQSGMMNFLKKLTNNGKIRAQYGTLDLIDEFITIEHQYFQLRGKIDFIPFLDLLLDRTEEFAKTAKISTEHKRVLTYLYTAILSKINSINKKFNQNTVFDLETFLTLECSGKQHQ